MAAYEQQRYERAAETLSQHVATYANHAPACMYLGIALLQLGRFDDAILALESARAHDRARLVREPVLWYLANGLLAMSKSEHASSVFEQLIELDGVYALSAREQLRRLQEITPRR